MRTLPAQSVIIALALAATLTFAQQAELPNTQSSSSKASKARAARISEVRGDVAIGSRSADRLQKAFTNLPITEGTRLQTGMGRAEVELEDNSTLRLGPYTAVEFPRLELLSTGATATTVHIIKGTTYISLIPDYIVKARGNEFLVTIDQQQLHLLPSSHLRIELEEAQAHLAIFDGSGRADGPSGTATLAKKKTYTFDLKSPSAPVASSKIQTAPTDKWDHRSAEYHKRIAGLTRSPNSRSIKEQRAGMPHDIF